MQTMLCDAYMAVALHMLGDYVLQTDFIAKTKGQNWWHLLSHCLTYSLPFALFFGVDWRIIALVTSHFVVDALKARYSKIDYVTDQICHLAILAIYVVI